MIDYTTFRIIYNAFPCQSEFELYFKNTIRAYMIIKYTDHVSFQRCGLQDGSQETEYSDLDKMFHTRPVDGIYLKNDWNKIEGILVNATYFLGNNNDFEAVKRAFNLVP